MLKESIRIFNGAAALTDLSLKNQDESTYMDLSSAQTVYIGQNYPFNNLFIHVDAQNTVSSSVSVEYWSSNDWVDAVDIVDASQSVAASFGKSGVLMFQKDKQYAWTRVADPSELGPSELSTLKIYDMYWARLIFSSALGSGTHIKTMQYAFCSSAELANYDVEVDGYLTSFSATKTDWNKEIMTASKLLVMDLRKLGIIDEAGQIVMFDDIHSACAYKTLYLIYSNLGKGYEDKKKQAKEEYDSLLSVKRIRIDESKDGSMDLRDKSGYVRTLTR